MSRHGSSTPCATLGQSTFAKRWVQVDTLLRRMKALMVATVSVSPMLLMVGLHQQACGLSRAPGLHHHQRRLLHHHQHHPPHVMLVITCIARERPLTSAREHSAVRTAQHVPQHQTAMRAVPSQRLLTAQPQPLHHHQHHLLHHQHHTPHVMLAIMSIVRERPPTSAQAHSAVRTAQHVLQHPAHIRAAASQRLLIAQRQPHHQRHPLHRV
jgi:hypothetical protein